MLKRSIYYAYLKQDDPRPRRAARRAGAGAGSTPAPQSDPSPQSPDKRLTAQNLKQNARKLQEAERVAAANRRKTSSNSSQRTLVPDDTTQPAWLFHMRTESDPDSNPSWSTRTESEKLTNNFIYYLADVFNHKLPTSPKSPSVLEGVLVCLEKRVQDTSHWTLTPEPVIGPSRLDFATLKKLLPEKVLANFYVSTAEMIAPILDFALDFQWMPMYQQIQSDLAFDGSSGK